MKISIITPTFNSEKTIEDCLRSVKSQVFDNYEHLIVDGKSNDATFKILKVYKSKFLSEHDRGIYDAMNKGIKNTTGDIIGILNSDDIFYDEFVLNKIYSAFEKSNCDIVYGNIVCVDQDDTNKIIRNYKTEPYTEKMFSNGTHPPHPGFFVKREVYEKYGYFSLKYKIAADYEFMLRVLKKYKLQSVFLDEYFVRMRIGGASNSSLKAIINSNKECRQSWIDNGMSPPFGITLKKPISKIKQLIIR